MARKTTGTTTTNRSKKTGAAVPPAAVQFVSEVPSSGKTPNLVPADLEEEIRFRAYELYLQRRAIAGGDNGDQNQDWLIAESEILLRHGRLARHTTA
jgi:hypothetical protein